MQEVTFNIYPIFKFIVILFAVIGGYWCLQNLVQTVSNTIKEIYAKKKDVEVVTDAFAKIGEVKNGTENEVILNKQNVENNKEIHANNLKYDELEQRIEKIEKYMQDMNDNVQLQLKSILEEFSKK